jgi:hypothetical protein
LYRVENNENLLNSSILINDNIGNNISRGQEDDAINMEDCSKNDIIKTPVKVTNRKRSKTKRRKRRIMPFRK